jgi:hypothetical protein
VIVEILLADGLGKAAPLVLNASQVLVRQDNGTPIMIAAKFGPDGAEAVGSLGHDAEEFNRFLRACGVNMTCVVQRLRLPKPPPGARLVAGPRPPKEDSDGQ